MMILLKLLCSLVIVGATQLENELDRLDEDTVDFPLTCYTRLYTFRARLEDANGRKCEGNITANACYGSCETWEYGTEDFPYRVAKSDVCMHADTEQVTVTLNDCQDGAEKRQFTYINAVTCACQSCSPDTAECLSRPGKKRNNQKKRGNSLQKLANMASTQRRKHHKKQKFQNDIF